ncbi:MAG: hypothetical protein AAFR16_05775, partial [Pseudomonadota bacterium]
RLDETLATPLAPLPLEETILTGREDVVLLSERKFFTAFLRTGFAFTSNPTQSNDDEGVDGIGTYNAGLRAATRIADTYDVYAEVSTFGARYVENDELDYSGVGAALGVSRDVGSYQIGGVYRPQIVFDEDFSDRFVTLHRVAGYASRQVDLAEDVIIAPTVTVSAIPADPSDFTRFEFEASAPMAYRAAPDWTLTARPTAFLRHYPDFFESVTGEDRVDVGGGASFSAQWSPETWVVVTALAAFEATHSSVQALSHASFSASPQVLLTLKF